MIIGIDLGTTNSLVGVWQAGQAQLISNSLGELMTPSVVGMGDDGSILVGQAAKERLVTHPHLTAANFKRLMGSSKTLSLGQQSFRAEELSAFVLRALKADAEAYLGEPVTEAIITVPAYFNDTQRKATIQAGFFAGLKVERLLNEPTAAALAYNLNLTEEESKFLVFDLGGGTFDVSVLHMFDGIMEVRASAGDNLLGGEDFTDLLMHAFLEDAKAVFPAPTPSMLARLKMQVEHFKCHIDQPDMQQLVFTWEEQTHSLSIDKAGFKALVTPLLNRLRQPVELALRDARMRAAELDQIILVGGATRMPIVRQLVTTLFGRFPNIALHPDQVVALGAAVQAGLKARDAALDDVVLTDVAPYSLGTDVRQFFSEHAYEDGVFLPIIERNMVIPVSRSKVLSTIVDNQSHMHIGIYQGEARKVADNIALGELNIPMPLRKAGMANVEVRFTYTVDGILEAECTQVETGERHQLVIENTPGTLSSEEILTKLAALNALKLHPREQLENTTVLARANRLYSQLNGDIRNQLGHYIGLFEATINDQDRDEIAALRKQLVEMLDEIEGEHWL